jgi:two-component system cell cycle response regulator
MKPRLLPALQTLSSLLERRGRRRRQVLKAGQIITDSESSTTDCIIRDLSESGARLRMAATGAVPKSFLLLVKDENVVVPVERVWRNDHEVGVKLVGSGRSAFC